MYVNKILFLSTSCSLSSDFSVAAVIWKILLALKAELTSHLRDLSVCSPLSSSSTVSLNQGSKNLAFLPAESAQLLLSLPLRSKSAWSAQEQDIPDLLMLLLTTRQGSQPAAPQHLQELSRSQKQNVPSSSTKHFKKSYSPKRCWLGLAQIQTWCYGKLSMPPLFQAVNMKSNSQTKKYILKHNSCLQTIALMPPISLTNPMHWIFIVILFYDTAPLISILPIRSFLLC